MDTYFTLSGFNRHSARLVVDIQISKKQTPELRRLVKFDADDSLGAKSYPVDFRTAQRLATLGSVEELNPDLEYWVDGWSAPEFFIKTRQSSSY